MDVDADRSERAQCQAAQGNPSSRHDLGFQAAMTADPGQLKRGWPGLQRSSYRESRVYMSARTPARYQQTH